jgi:hypothetical protein
LLLHKVLLKLGDSKGEEKVPRLKFINLSFHVIYKWKNGKIKNFQYTFYKCVSFCFIIEARKEMFIFFVGILD